MTAREELLEAKIRQLQQTGELLLAFEAAMQGYTPWLKAWLMRRIRDEQRAKDIFQEVSLKVWRGLKKFQWNSRFKTWLCVIALREIQRHPASVEECQLDSQETSGLPPQVSSVGARLDKQQQLSRLFSQFSQEEQCLILMKQVETDTSWEEIAAASALGRSLSPQELKRESNRLRQQFCRLMERLREAALDEPDLAGWFQRLL